MPVTITLRDDLADGLARQAGDRHISLEEWTTRILEEAVGDNSGEIAWIKLNSRRLALISKECTTGLTDAEAAELAVLQDAAAKASEPQDRKLLERLTACEEQANWRCAPMPAETSRACLR
jgi:hypothetical protein